ncbi:uncharacterized protein BO88DRAFT_106470 [Aspergillus vadensis CBS 113365]|uniref:Uncharacterized protein n=1 Tax=Aspergillus vadensis (strain CBS 113365 / IMI 142717 / IBT 24658) TaxID=1448311 RepID=A0A319BMF8_ASPVC|nr:hypothetical protein BO88DRAFT_106470 [Aspergillus vadensis CBS 113365]PYH73855.1 hypothetical protein BO88DRAFT_106470 [Aspergillus vadensis CBS 113365]
MLTPARPIAIDHISLFFLRTFTLCFVPVIPSGIFRPTAPHFDLWRPSPVASNSSAWWGVPSAIAKVRTQLCRQSSRVPESSHPYYLYPTPSSPTADRLRSVSETELVAPDTRT